MTGNDVAMRRANDLREREVIMNHLDVKFEGMLQGKKFLLQKGYGNSPKQASPAEVIRASRSFPLTILPERIYLYSESLYVIYAIYVFVL